MSTTERNEVTVMLRRTGHIGPVINDVLPMETLLEFKQFIETVNPASLRAQGYKMVDGKTVRTVTMLYNMLQAIEDYVEAHNTARDSNHDQF